MLKNKGLLALTIAASAGLAGVLPASPALAAPEPAPVIAFHTTIDEFLKGETVEVGVFVGTEDVPATGRVILKSGAQWLTSTQLSDGFARLEYTPPGGCTYRFELTCGSPGLYGLEVAYDGYNGAGGWDPNYTAAADYISVAVLPVQPAGQQAIYRSYFDLLDRNPDLSGEEYWWQKHVDGVPRHVMQYAMLFSDEYAYNRIADEYWRFFDRDPDEEGGDYYAGKVQQGMPLEYLSVDLVDSEEFYEQAGGTDEGFVAEAYARILYREADQGGLDYYVGELAKGAG